MNLPTQDDDDHERRGQRRRYDHQPLHIKVRKQLLSIAESPLRRGHEEAQSLAQLVADNYSISEELKIAFLDLVPQLCTEQPLKTPFVAAVLLVANTIDHQILADTLSRIAIRIEEQIKAGEWREVKCSLKLLACLHPCLEGDGIFPLLEELFNRAGDLQATNSDDVSCILWAYIRLNNLVVVFRKLTFKTFFCLLCRPLALRLSRSFCSPYHMPWRPTLLVSNNKRST